jgi:4-amino-4-deoxy-L-arabinose transferase-like glycosyltransferase
MQGRGEFRRFLVVTIADQSFRCDAPRFVAPSVRWPALGLVVLLLLTVAIRVADPTGWLGSDDASYYSAAEHILDGKKIDRQHHQFARMSTIVPVALSVRLFGHSPQAVAFPMLLASVLCVLAVAWLGRMIWGWWEGLLAATIVSVLPYFRVLSTTGYPDVHACLWATAAVLLAVIGVGQNRRSRMLICCLGSGLAMGLATSSKIFAMTASLGLLVVIFSSEQTTRREQFRAFLALVCGGVLYFAVDGLFYLWAAGDFLYKLRALEGAQSSDHLFAGMPGYPQLALDRLCVLFEVGTSGWGRIAVLFWPAAVAVLLLNRRGRAIAVWALAGYLLVALMPVRFKNGPQPMPIFHGRHVLTASIPFALCSAWTVRRTAAWMFSDTWVLRAWPVLAAAVVALAYVNPHELNGFRSRHTSWIGEGIQQIVALNHIQAGRDVFVPPSLYLRYRIFFPPELRSRLRVSVDEDSPDWWRDAAVDIASRERPLPLPGHAYLVATPSQMKGEPEFWDYGVSLPQEGLEAWRDLRPLTTIGVFERYAIRPMKPGDSRGVPILILLGGETAVTNGTTEVDNDAIIG